MNKFRLRASLGKIKEMSVKINKEKNKNKRNDSCVSDFISSHFSPIMADLAAGSSAEENTSLTLDKSKRDSLLESKLHRASFEKISCLQETVS